MAASATEGRRRTGEPSAGGPLEVAPGLARIAAGAWLTPFGGHFCEFCLPLETGAIETLGERIYTGVPSEG